MSMKKLDDLLALVRVRAGQRVALRQRDPDGEACLKYIDKDAAPQALGLLCRKLAKLQEIIYAEHKHKILIVLQAMDTAGKDSVIRHVFGSLNPLGVRAINFRAPTLTELDHDYLWRVHAQAPGKGEFVVFNRSHYEDVLVVRVREYVTPQIWKRRYEQINDFERMLCAEGTTILKFFLQISASEQKKRLEERRDNPRKQWKFRHEDIEERKFWLQYQTAYAAALTKTNTVWSPWHIVPANRKWLRDLIVAGSVVRALENLRPRLPAASGMDTEVEIPAVD
ncbi:MAG: polyphosphate kinase 2 family protein [Candidatus Omnitrophica bacterium]|nr:polyphosphate kinase 2 family protein [Candidatus Omnitrophota bacterium]